MKRYDMENQYEPYTGQHEGIAAIESDDGDWVPADVAQGLYDALLSCSDWDGLPPHLQNKADDALAAADGEEV